MTGDKRLKAYARQKGADPHGLSWELTAKQARRYGKKWWRDATPQEQAEYKALLVSLGWL